MNDTTRTALRAEQGMWEAFAEEERIKQEMAAMGTTNDATPREADRATDEIIAAFEAVLLSDEVVEAAAKVLYSHYPARIWHTPTESTALPWEETASEDRSGKRRIARKQLQAAIAAAKGTEEGSA